MFNKVVLIGRLTVNPELKYTQSGKAVASFSMAVDGPYIGSDSKPNTVFANIVCWGKMAENVQKYTGKGSMVMVEGKLNTQKYEKDGETKIKWEIVADKVLFLNKNYKQNENIDISEFGVEVEAHL